MEAAVELREAVVSADCAIRYRLLLGLIQSLAKLSPSKDVLRGSGIGHVVGDRHIWGLAGLTTQRKAAALQASWRQAVRQSGPIGTATPTAPKGLEMASTAKDDTTPKHFRKATPLLGWGP